MTECTACNDLGYTESVERFRHEGRDVPVIVISCNCAAGWRWVQSHWREHHRRHGRGATPGGGCHHETSD